MKIEQANLQQLKIVKTITHQTIREIYSHYYALGAVQFFLNHHSNHHIMKGIKNGDVYLIYHHDDVVGTVTINENEICRLFVLPKFQGHGFGSKLISFAENEIAKNYESIVLDASLPAKSLYLKRGYVIKDTHSLLMENGDYLCYDNMQKKCD